MSISLSTINRALELYCCSSRYNKWKSSMSYYFHHLMVHQRSLAIRVSVVCALMYLQVAPHVCLNTTFLLYKEGRRIVVLTLSIELIGINIRIQQSLLIWICHHRPYYGSGGWHCFNGPIWATLSLFYPSDEHNSTDGDIGIIYTTIQNRMACNHWPGGVFL